MKGMAYFNLFIGLIIAFCFAMSLVNYDTYWGLSKKVNDLKEEVYNLEIQVQEYTELVDMYFKG